ncbi:glycosyltransferase family 9 protein [bacterium]|nr:MAG: glycosyltransferase family 9 protein [bacterium]
MTVILNPKAIRSILIIKLRAVGDVLLSTVVTPNLRQAFPGARIDFLTEPPSADVLRGNPSIDETLVFNSAAMSGAALIRMVRRRGYDLVIDLFGNPRTALVTRMSGARYRVGFRFRQRAYAYNIIVEPRGAKVHNTQFNLDALEAIGVPVIDRSPQFRYSHEDEEYVNRFAESAFEKERLIVGISTGGGWYTKRWGMAQYAELAERLVSEFGAQILLLWGPGQRPEVERLQSLMKSPSVIPPATSLKQLGALLQRCSYVVSNDSGPMHLAAAVGTPVLGIFGPTNPVLQGPYGPQNMIVRKEGLDCLGCNLTECPIGNICMTELSVETVMDAVKELMVRNGLFAP